MTNLILKQFVIIWPEISLTLLALLSQLSALFLNKRFVSAITIFISVILLFLTIQYLGVNQVGFNNSFIITNFTSIYKFLILLFSIIVIITYRDYCKIINEEFKMEFVTLVLLSTMGSFVAISSQNFLLLFCGMELQALIGYVLAGFSINNIKSSEGALKYFILGALISCLSLFGISFIYGFGGSLEYGHILFKLNSSEPNIGLIIGVTLFLSSLFFKLSAVPLHVWTPDVYEGSPTPVVSYFSSVTKIANVIILLNISTMVVGEYKQISINLVKIIAILSMLVGAYGAIKQDSLKRLMGYSTILNIGYVLMGISLHSEIGNIAALGYMVIYAVSTVGFFACLIALLGVKSDTAVFADLNGLAANRKALAGVVTVIMFSLIGIPPLAGFFGKYYLFYQAIAQKQYILAFIAIGTSIIAAYYYLKIVRSLYFFEPNQIVPQYFVQTSEIKGLKIINYLVVSFLLLVSLIIVF
ncbi:MAG: NADH-quinone oxidoreductase subunit NuoN [Rickettsia endosymbiont of Bryobia graminum]|nr:NADH-quinone oxidoreductase subunit NuoN [Rickettsia endosymbiont of Bryobia graminum]